MGIVWVGAWTSRAVSDDDASEALSWLRVVSVLATIALALIVATGLFKSWRATAGVLSALWSSSYGITLAAKITLVSLAAGLGGLNRWVFLPRVQAARPARRAFVVVLRIEAVVLVFVAVLATVLSNLEPPGSM